VSSLELLPCSRSFKHCLRHLWQPASQIEMQRRQPPLLKVITFNGLQESTKTLDLPAVTINGLQQDLTTLLFAGRSLLKMSADPLFSDFFYLLVLLFWWVSR
jgi:hypothetical protein